MLTERLQVLVDEAMRSRLESEAARTGRSVGALVRSAIDHAYPATSDARRDAAAALLDAEPMTAPPVAELLTELDTVRSRRDGG